MKKIIRITSFLMLALSIAVSGSITSQAQVQYVPNAGVFINGKVVDGINPIIENGVYYLPFVDLAKILKYNHIKFEENTKTYEITDGSTIIRVTMGGTRARKGNEYVNIQATTMD